MIVIHYSDNQFDKPEYLEVENWNDFFQEKFKELRSKICLGNSIDGFDKNNIRQQYKICKEDA